MPGNHKLDDKCKCDMCELDHQASCIKPHGCASTALKLLNKLPPKWDPRFTEMNRAETLDDASEEDVNREVVTFNVSITMMGRLSEGFRVFTNVKKLNAMAMCNDLSRSLNVVMQFCISGTCEDDVNDNAQAGAWGYFPTDAE